MYISQNNTPPLFGLHPIQLEGYKLTNKKYPVSLETPGQPDNFPSLMGNLIQAFYLRVAVLLFEQQPKSSLFSVFQGIPLGLFYPYHLQLLWCIPRRVMHPYQISKP